MKILYLAFFILLILLLINYSRTEKLSEDNQAVEEADEIYTAGATMRVIGQTFSGGDQAEDKRSYNILEPIKRPTNIHELHRMQLNELDEHMVNEARAPEFWEINPILGQFKEDIMKF